LEQEKNNCYYGCSIVIRCVWSSSMRCCRVWRDLLQRQRQHRSSRLFFPSQLKLAPHLSASHCHFEARDPWSSSRATLWRES